MHQRSVPPLALPFPPDDTSRFDVRRSPPSRLELYLKSDTSRVFFRDQVLFTLGIVNALLTAALLASRPRLFPVVYACVLPFVYAWLVFSYAVRRFWGFYLLDFCHFANACAFLYFVRAHARGAAAALPPAHDTEFACVFALTTGPLLLANLPWRVSLVPHSPDKMASLFVHAVAPLAVYAWRWHGGGSDAGGAARVRPLLDLLVAPLAAYGVWQLAYLLLTEAVFARMLEREPRFATSLKYLTASSNRDALRSRADMYLRMARALGAVQSPAGLFDPAAVRTKFFFVVFQALYTALSLVAAALAFVSHDVHAALLGAVGVVTIYNGAGFYVRVFSLRYREETELKVREVLNSARDIST